MKKRSKILYAISEIISAIWTSSMLVLDIFGFFEEWNLKVSALIGFIFFIIIILNHIILLNNKLEDKIPNLVVTNKNGLENPFTSEVLTKYVKVHQIGQSKQQRKKIKMVHVYFSNEPKNQNDQNDGKDIRAEISYYDENDNLILGPINGRWGDTLEPINLNPDEKRQILSINFPSNGDVRGLDIAFRYPNETNCYAFNNESYFSEGEQFKLSKYKINAEKIFVKVVLIGQFINRKVFWFTLLNDQKNHNLTLIREKNKPL